MNATLNATLLPGHPVLSLEAAARIVGCCAGTLRKAVLDGRLRAARIGSHYRIGAAALADYAATIGAEHVAGELDAMAAVAPVVRATFPKQGNRWCYAAAFTTTGEPVLGVPSCANLLGTTQDAFRRRVGSGEWPLLKRSGGRYYLAGDVARLLERMSKPELAARVRGWRWPDSYLAPGGADRC